MRSRGDSTTPNSSLPTIREVTHHILPYICQIIQGGTAQSFTIKRPGNQIKYIARFLTVPVRINF